MATKAEREQIDKTVAGQQALFVGSLATSISDEDLCTAFEKFGDVITAKVIMARDDPTRSRGFGFVTYNSPKEAKAALDAMDGKELRGRIIRCRTAEDRRQMNAEARRAAQREERGDGADSKSDTSSPPPSATGTTTAKPAAAAKPAVAEGAAAAKPAVAEGAAKPAPPTLAPAEMAAKGGWAAAAKGHRKADEVAAATPAAGNGAAAGKPIAATAVVAAAPAAAPTAAVVQGATVAAPPAAAPSPSAPAWGAGRSAAVTSAATPVTAAVVAAPSAPPASKAAVVAVEAAVVPAPPSAPPAAAVPVSAVAAPAPAGAAAADQSDQWSDEHQSVAKAIAWGASDVDALDALYALCRRRPRALDAPNPENTYKWTLLHTAVINCRPLCAALLLAHGASDGAVDTWSYTPLRLAQEHNETRSGPVIELLKAAPGGGAAAAFAAAFAPALAAGTLSADVAAFARRAGSGSGSMGSLVAGVANVAKPQRGAQQNASAVKGVVSFI